MTNFNLPTGDFELLLRKKCGVQSKSEWKSVMFADSLTEEEIAMCTEKWAKNYKIEGARYNGKAVNIPTSYHWEHRINGETIGCYSVRKDAENAVNERKRLNRRNLKEYRIPIGGIWYVKD